MPVYFSCTASSDDQSDASKPQKPMSAPTRGADQTNEAHKERVLPSLTKAIRACCTFLADTLRITTHSQRDRHSQLGAMVIYDQSRE